MKIDDCAESGELNLQFEIQFDLNENVFADEFPLCNYLNLNYM